MKPLQGQVAVVAGATRGAGRGISRALGEAGATVYCSGRSSRTQPNTTDHHYAGRPETIEETAELVTAAGGAGIAVRVDHTVEAEVAALFARVKREQKRLDLLVNVLTGKPVASWKSFWNLPLDESRRFVEGWLWPHVVTCWHAAPLMVARKSGLMVEIIEQDGIGYHGQFFFDLMEISLKRLSYGMAHDLAPKGVAALAITPGFMRTEAILEQFGVTEANWREAAENNPEAKKLGFIASETPCFVGRAVAALAADPQVKRKSGGVYSSGALAEEYGFTDVDGSRPNMYRYMKEHFPQLVSGKPPTAVEWRIVAAELAATS
jgi:NAD(P)-dependent dehydrogenase (short-subunit alcohol dehydrogenase family)